MLNAGLLPGISAHLMIFSEVSFGNADNQKDSNVVSPEYYIAKTPSQISLHISCNVDCLQEI